MKTPKTIFVSHLLEVNSLHTREQAQRLIQEAEIMLLHHEPVWIDYAGIDFMSRSFADEFLKLASFWKLKNQLDWLGLSESVKNMMEMVVQSRIGTQNKSLEIPSVVVTDEEVLYRFLAAV
jgi:anti-anti-sigma regulatory factor